MRKRLFEEKDIEDYMVSDDPKISKTAIKVESLLSSLEDTLEAKVDEIENVLDGIEPAWDRYFLKLAIEKKLKTILRNLKI